MTSAVKLRDYGDQAVLIETDDVVAVRNSLMAQGHPNITAIVPAARTVLVEYLDERPDLASMLSRLDPAEFATAADTPVELPVRYGGTDLAVVAEQTGLSAAEVVARHSDREYLVRFCGFSPGFGYLTGLDERLQLPRLASPRTSVPAGSVAIAGEFTGVYPRSSPGGWHLLGRTDANLFDLARTPPALLTPGRRVRFIPQ